MQPEIVQKLTQINHKFYQSFAAEFSSTRQRLQPGVLRLLPNMLTAKNMLDMGCGNGNLAAALAEGGYAGQYLGIDGSPGLVEAARRLEQPGFEFRQGDLSAPNWAEDLPGAPYDLICCFATLHHLPGEDLRLAVLGQVQAMLSPGGLFVHSNWQPSRSERLRQRFQPWSRVGLGDEQLDEGDLLMDWRRGGEGLRYVHEYSEAELRGLAEKSGFTVEEVYSSDGESGDLGLYMLWRKSTA